MQRREAVRLLGVIAAVPFLPQTAEAASALAERVHRDVQGGSGFRTLDAAQQRLVSRIADAIIPATDTPGAIDVQVPQFIDHILSDWASPGERTLFLAGLTELAGRARGLDGSAFLELLGTLDGERSSAAGAGHAFGRIKSLTVYGYFTSQIVQRDVLKTQLAFSTYVGCAPV
jgi:hypothetical protein